MSVNPLAGFLARAFPAHVCFPPDCWVRRAIEQNYEGYDVGAAVEVALQEGSEAAIAVRLRLEHPAARAHLSRHDDGLLNAFTEVEALAWASRVARIGLCEFVTTQGAPDLRVGDTHWIEAKTIQRSNSDTRALEEACREAAASGDMLVRSGTIGDIGPGLVAKFDSQFQDALLKWKRQRQMANFVVFYCLEGVDWDVDSDNVWALVEDWARARARGRADTRIVIVDNYQWKEPRLDSVRF